MKRITIITGHYGSGKSEFSINLALAKQVDYLVDLDIVNPYFRSREQANLLEEHGVKLISSTIPKSLGSDLPYIAKESFHPFYQSSIRAIYDLGGDDIGARLLRQYQHIILDEEAILLLCINVFREQTSTVQKILQVMQKIESSGGVKIGGLINNSNFLRETTIEDVMYAQEIIQEVARQSKLPICYTALRKDLLPYADNLAGEVLGLTLYLRKKWL